MAASYIDTTYIAGFIGTARVTALTNASGQSSATMITAASVLVQAAAQNAGYTIGDSTTNDTVKLATFGQFLLIAYGNKGEKVPDQFAAVVNLAEAIRTGAVPLPGLSPNGEEAIGGSVFSESATSIAVSDGARPQIFSRKNQDVY